MGSPDAPISPLPHIDDSFRQGLHQIYDRLTEEMRRTDVSCDTCGACCHFDHYDHQLWITSLELTCLLETPLPSHELPSGICPYLQDARCTARDNRALGCRIFHCQGNIDDMELLYERYLEDIRQLYADHDMELQYGELLSSLRCGVHPTRSLSGAKPSTRP